ncbi:PKD domain-containing protein, partial [Flavisolibacter ginsengisoli]
MRKFYAALPCTLFLLFALIFSLQGNSQVQTLRPNVYINAECNGFAEYLPEGYNTGTQTYPLLIFIEGIGETGNGSLTDLQKLYNNGPPKYINEGSFPTSFTVNGQTHRFIIFTPQITIPIWQRYPTAAEINEIIDYAVSHYRVNTSRIYLVGISTGAGSVWNYCGSSALYSNRLAAIAPFTGTDTPTLAKSKVIASTNLPIWAFHNRYDDGVALTYTTGYTDTITMLGCNPPPKVTIFDASGHDSWFYTLAGVVPPNNTLNVYQWMLQYTRGSSPPPNQPPTANAGTDKTITLPTNSVSLTGSGSDPDGTIASYSWTKVSGGAATINSPGSASTTISGLAQGTYIFRLTVTDNAGATASDDVTVIVNAAPNQPPTANAGADKTITLPTNSVSLAGSGSDPDGSITAYSWTKVSGGSATINSPGASTTTVSGLVQGSYIFRLTVTDNSGATAFDDVNVTVNPAPNQPPTANAGTDKNITLPTNSVTLSGSGSDPDGTITAYSWTKVSGGAATINSPGASSTTVSGLVQGNYIFRLTVTDNSGATAFDDVNVVVNATPNQSPTANAGTDQNITLPTNAVTLTGSGSDPDGSIASYSWTKVTGGTASISSPGSASTSVTGLSQGSYTFRLTVTDNNGATAFDDVVVNVNAAANQSPTANAGADKTITLPANSVSLTGSGSDPDGSITAYSWTKVSGGAATINSPGAASTTVSGLTQGSYIFRLTVTDNNGATASDDVNVTVNGAANQSPTANAGADQTITLPANSVTLSGSGSDPDGSIASYAWSKVSGGAATINSPSAATTTVSGLAQGSYIFRLTVTDNAGATAFDDV